MGDPVEMGRYYSDVGADELVFLDISATSDGRDFFAGMVKKVASELSIPFTVGGGIRDIDGAARLLDSGADKVSINSAAIDNPLLIEEIAGTYGNQFVVVAIDAIFENGIWRVKKSGGRQYTKKELFDWARESQERGAGEILFTSINHDGTKSGFATEALSKLSSMLQIPVIASGGAGKMHHFRDLFEADAADAALAASVFHNGEIEIKELKQYLSREGLNIRT
jgi:cyclase